MRKAGDVAAEEGRANTTKILAGQERLEGKLEAMQEGGGGGGGPYLD